MGFNLKCIPPQPPMQPLQTWLRRHKNLKAKMLPSSYPPIFQFQKQKLTELGRKGEVMFLWVYVR